MAIADTSDSAGRVTGYSWNFGDGSSAVTSQFASHTYTTPGSYNVTATVTDDNGHSVPSSFPVTVTAPASGTLTVTTHAFTPTSGIAPFNLQAIVGSSDSGGRVTGYSWNFGDGSSAVTSQFASHTYTTPGSYTATVTVTDDNGHSIPASFPVTVTAKH